MTSNVILPLGAAYAELCNDYGINVSSVDEAYGLVKTLCDTTNVDQKQLGAAMLVLGMFYRVNSKYREAERMYIQARGRFVENPLEVTRETARATWLLAENHYNQCNFTLGRDLFGKAVREFNRAGCLATEEGYCCLEDFMHWLGVERDQPMVEAVDEALECVASFYHLGGQGPIHFNHFPVANVPDHVWNEWMEREDD